MAKYQKIKGLTIAQQKAGILYTYGKLVSFMSKNRETVDCLIKLQPSEESRVYTVRIRYNGYGFPHAWMIEPDLEQYDGLDPHHIYGKDKNGHPELCVYHPGEDNWNSQKSLASVFIPWVITWIHTYEIWLITGMWLYPEAGDGSDEE